MSPMPPKRPAGPEASPAPQQAAQPGFGRAPVDFTDQASFAPDVDASPYAAANAPKAAKRAARGARAASPKQQAASAPAQPAAAPVPVPGTVDVRSQMHVVVGGTHNAPQRPSASGQAQRAVKAAMRTVKQPQQAGPEPLSQQRDEAQFPAEQDYIKAVEQAAQARPSARTANVARPKPKPQPAGRAPEGDRTRAEAPHARQAPASRPARQTRAAAAAPQAARDTESFVRRVSVALTCVVCVAATCLTLYAPAQQLYSAMRENERLTDELAQNQVRVDALSKSVSSLQTAEGVQDMAHKTWGLVMPDEVALTVDNASYTPADTQIPAEVKRGSGQNTSTWVTDVLDQVFGEAGSTTATESDEVVATLSETADADSSQVQSALPDQSQTE